MTALPLPLLLLVLSQADAPLTPPPPPPQLEVEPESLYASDPDLPGQLADEPLAGSMVTVVTKDGQSLSGKLIRRTSAEVVLELGGSPVRLPGALIARIESGPTYFTGSDGELWFADPNRTQYFFARSAMMLERKEVQFSQKELAGTLVSLGATDFLNIDLGTAVPAYFAGFDGLNFLVGVRGGGEVLSWLHLGTGVQALIIPAMTRFVGGVPLMGLISGTATLGSRDRNVTFSGGMPFNLVGSSSSSQRLGSPLFTLSGNLRVSKMVALLSETWLYLDYTDLQRGFVLVTSGGLRVMGERWAFSLGLALTASNRGPLNPIPFPLPLLDFTYNFY